MLSRTGRLATAGLAVLVAVPAGARAQALDPSVVTGSPPLRAVIAFLLALLAGGAVLARYEPVVHRSVDEIADRPLGALVYGLMAQFFVAFAGGVVLTQLSNAGADGLVVSAVGTVVVGGALLAMGGLGLVVVGTWLTDRRGDRRPRNGLLVGAALGAIGWLVLPIPGALAAWGVLVAAGVGGPTRNWVHAERSVEADAEGEVD